MSSTTASSWHDEKPRHARDVAKQLERLRRDACGTSHRDVSLEELPEFRDLQKFAALGEQILVHEGRVPATSFTHSKHFRAIVRGAHRELFGSPFRVRAPRDDETETKDIARTISFAKGSPKEETSPETPILGGERSSSRHAFTLVLLVLAAIALLALVTGVIVCDVCVKNFEELTTTDPSS